MEDVVSATKSYERWVGGYTSWVAADLRLKHQKMEASLFWFFRATYYRWVQLARGWRDEGRGTIVPGVGDLHVENFGTWRDAEGRLVWGINDFDEAGRLPWTDDLIRLAASIRLAIQTEQLHLGFRAATEALWEGYRDGIRSAGRPFVLEEEHQWLRTIALAEERNPVLFWARLRALPRAAPAIAHQVGPVLMDELEASGRASARIARRVAGLGSLGRPRLVAIVGWHGGLIAREAKAFVPSARHWLQRRTPSLAAAAKEQHAVVAGASRAADPFFEVRVSGRRSKGDEVGWIIRRLGPHCRRIQLTDLPAKRDELLLAHAFGFEAANVHLGGRGARARITAELRHFGPGWLRRVAKEAATAVARDWRVWRRYRRSAGTTLRG